jgi:hypothetical protein
MRQKHETRDGIFHEHQLGSPGQELAANLGGEHHSSTELEKEALSVVGEETEEGAGRGSRGIWIALATFVPTFLVIFFGIPYLAGLPLAPRFPAGLKGSTPPIVSSLAPETGFVEAPPKEPARPPLKPANEALQNPADSVAAPAAPRPALQPTRPEARPKTAQPKPSASTATKDASLVLAAAFADRDSAQRFAASIARQGYPVEVRRDDSSSRSWAVWIGKRPRGKTPPRGGNSP